MSAAGLRTYDELAAGLRALRVWSGLSFRDLHRRVVAARRERGVPELPVYNTVYRCLQPGRTRIDIELIADIVRAFGAADHEAEWRQACAVASGEILESGVVSVQDTLPAGTTVFIGRGDELRLLLTRPDPAAATLIAVEGMAGVGKTCLVTHAAHLLTGEHGHEACLWVDLRGYDPQLPPADPTAVLDGLLRRLGVPGQEISRLGLEARRERFRQALTATTALIVLDNAASEEQVRPLLAETPGSITLVTSRRHLTGLPADHRIELGVLTAAESVELLLGDAGSRPDDRSGAGPTVRDDSRASEQIVELLGHLPLAVALIASRIRSTPDWTLDDQLTRLVERQEGLAVEDGIELALASSYDRLSSGRQRLLRLIALHPGQDLDAYAAAALGGVELPEAERGLDDLAAHHLVQRSSAGRITLHDLIRLFARDRSRNDDPPRQRQEAMTRLLDHCRYTAARAADLLSPHRGDYDDQLIGPGTPSPPLPDRDAAAYWLETERTNLIGLALHAAGNGQASYTGDLSWILLRFLDVGAYCDDAELLHGTAVALLDGRAAANARWGLGIVHRWHGHLELAQREYLTALEIAQQHNDQALLSRVRLALGVVSGQMGRYEDAAGHFRQALSASEASGQRSRCGIAHNNLGAICLNWGRIDEAIGHLRTALVIAREMSDRPTEARVLGHLGIAATGARRCAEALDYHAQMLDLARQEGNPALEGFGLNNRGDTLRALGRLSEAADMHRQALALAEEVSLVVGILEARNSLGETLLALGQADAARAEHQTVLSLVESCRNRPEEGRAHDGLAQALIALGADAEAQQHLRRALNLLTEVGSPRADQIAAQLEVVRS
ncbi:tetratricopeptide repeat protein [Kribbella sp. DT2]|uniref:tetratricopeptide repeat protein n=1 Tax=Kribbella sp. DT2 TaxID=3393427 RepID=UPI003CE6724D